MEREAGTKRKKEPPDPGGESAGAQTPDGTFVKTVGMSLLTCLPRDYRQDHVRNRIQDAVKRQSKIIYDASLLANAYIVDLLLAHQRGELGVGDFPSALNADGFYANAIYRVTRRKHSDADNSWAWPSVACRTPKDKEDDPKALRELRERVENRARLRGGFDRIYHQHFASNGHVMESREKLSEPLHMAARQMAANAEEHLARQTETLLHRVAMYKLKAVDVPEKFRDTLTRRILRFVRPTSSAPSSAKKKKKKKDEGQKQGDDGPVPQPRQPQVLVCNDPGNQPRVSPETAEALAKFAQDLLTNVVQVQGQATWELTHPDHLLLNHRLFVRCREERDRLSEANKNKKKTRRGAPSKKRKRDLREVNGAGSPVREDDIDEEEDDEVVEKHASPLPLSDAKPRFITVTAKAVSQLFGPAYVDTAMKAKRARTDVSREEGAGEAEADGGRDEGSSDGVWYRQFLSIPERHFERGDCTLTSFSTDGVQIKLTFTRTRDADAEIPGLQVAMWGPKERRKNADRIPRHEKNSIRLDDGQTRGIYDLETLAGAENNNNNNNNSANHFLRGCRLVGNDPGRVDVATWVASDVGDDGTTNMPLCAEDLRRGSSPLENPANPGAEFGSVSNADVRWQCGLKAFRAKELRRRKRMDVEAVFESLQNDKCSCRARDLDAISAYLAQIWKPETAHKLQRYYWHKGFFSKWRFRRACRKSSFLDHQVNRFLGCTRKYEREREWRMGRAARWAAEEQRVAAEKPPRKESSPEVREAYRQSLRARREERKRARRETRDKRVDLPRKLSADDYAAKRSDGVTRCKRTVVGFGNGRFSVCSAGNDPCPRKELIRRLSRRAVVLMVDEYRTSKTCCACGREMDKLKAEELLPEWKEKVKRGSDKEEKKAVLRRLGRILRCPTCRTTGGGGHVGLVGETGNHRVAARGQGRLWNRDINAAINMILCVSHWIVSPNGTRRPRWLERPTKDHRRG